ncbi:MAG: TIGR02646 family protein [Dehalococcoidia bacterium]|nr:TIGR02646 family protein [Dehalococcoidia bacterium]
MRWVDRGPEPAGVAEYAGRFTQGRIDYFRSRVGQRPTDFLWVVFRPALASRTDSICWYCEQGCDTHVESGGRAPTVDHFRPLSCFPELAYEWSNWVFSCRRCNDNKANKWPDLGYVDPCADDVSDRPDRYFDYDVLTGDVEPRSELSPTAKRRAWDTIDDLGLNKLDVKIHRMECIQEVMNGLISRPISEREAFIESNTGRAVEHAGAIGMVAKQLRQARRL